MVCGATSASGPFFDRSGENCATQNGGTLVLGSHGDVYAPGGEGVAVDGGGRNNIMVSSMTNEQCLIEKILTLYSQQDDRVCI
jgi:hypothetical protein